MSTGTALSITVEPLEPTIGGEVRGVDLRVPLDAERWGYKTAVVGDWRPA
jgi:hypothetical protein